MSYIQSFHIENLWGYKRLQWDNIHEDVNIIVGINGSGKTTLLNAMYQYFTEKALRKLKINAIPEQLPSNLPIIYLQALDNVLLRDKRKSESQLLQELDSTVYNDKDGRLTFFSYRSMQIDKPDEAGHINKRIKQLFAIIDNLFADTNKSIEISNQQLAFIQHDSGARITLDQLSSGEKQMLLLLLKVFLTDEKPAIIFMDEPEISMHISWQNQLIDILRSLNPQAQLFLTTHSPSILSRGWGDKITYMEDITKPL